jgi:REP element-mobilizing transposase RayT
MQDFGSINWRSRGYLPHFDAEDVQQHIIIGLADAISYEIIESDTVKRLWLFDEALDRDAGECVLATPRCASIVQNELLHHDGDRYRLLAWCVMPNHVHIVADRVQDLPGTVRRWKTWTTRQINAVVGREGGLWKREYFERFARSEHHLQTMIHYVEQNPVVAGLVATASDWEWSSAGYRKSAGQAPGGPRLPK